MKRRTALAGQSFVLPGLASTSRNQAVKGEPGVSPREITFGQICDMSASRAAVALAYSAGARLHFDAVNQRGGVHGRLLRTVQFDDG
ncbi:hypothetical protein [Hydrogenophaga sp.]|uniref:hypothetical protein n=1 Tax=Hydrogenophaga sp. TaxID=1904254 RepID=UPI002633F050|nr:hypothetical protein [Hydrogenophaga sp.]MDM7948058.1 hypothetical protein [Hydrogenophaga sp.]